MAASVWSMPVRSSTWIGQKFEWCAQASSPGEKIARYELFWGHYHPKDEEYDDDIQGRLVRRCTYHLADLYAEVGDIPKSRHFLKWLEEKDSAWIR